MIRIKPYVQSGSQCSCGGEYVFKGLLWQGIHICEEHCCSKCGNLRIDSLPINQSGIEQYSFYPRSGIVVDNMGTKVKENWFTRILRTIGSPIERNVDIEIEVRNKYDNVLILNTLDYIYGHSLLYLLNLQRIIKAEKSFGVVVLVQPMLKWLVPKEGVDEIWIVNLSFKDFNFYHKALSEKINAQLTRFKSVYLSNGYVIPTNESIDIEKFSGIFPFDFNKPPEVQRITFIWREDPDRLWIRNIYLTKGLKRLGFKKILLPLQYCRVILLMRMLRSKFGTRYKFTVAGLGNTFKMPGYIIDERVNSFNDATEIKLCKIYAESMVVIGVHGSSMLMPSAHAGMTLSLMPSKRWGNFAEDILFSENDSRLALFQKRIIPMNLSIFEIRDIVTDMLEGRTSFIKKFIHSEEL